ncbi:MAG: biopolymer transporter ExbD [Candidatus Eisenbacteria bacterium]|uniref:Biopolymer transporter ExbD n=1 Tax=Eiseniibacteriota bacterium TaxID=2212470 RepID=A0A9D6L624_UNCEI|nr:biopolymer transporter ExbD [Candidatus Eisenbacteria bacterium]MBI3539578.1 biopolymer transporter ExbD [Candidatus Eisenbacteria bacterium]
MGAVDAPQPRSSGKKKGKGIHRPKRRVGVRIDMTPMVDVAFLLLIFFMVTTVFRTPQALEINLPPDKDVKIEVAQSKVLTVRVLPDNRAYWRRGEDPWARVDVGSLSAVFKVFHGNKDIVVLIKIDRDAKFNNMVSIIDELDLAGLTRFSLATLDPNEKKEVEAL